MTVLSHLVLIVPPNLRKVKFQPSKWPDTSENHPFCTATSFVVWSEPAPYPSPMKSKLGKILGKNVKIFRLKKGWSQEELASKADVSPNFVGYIERGERGIRIGNIEQIARALNIHPKDLFKGY